MARKKKFKDMSPRQRAGVMGVLAVALPLIAAAQRDLQRRPESEVRGRKWVWRLACLNALGALAYFGWGRKDPAASGA
ncbi:MAG TPA: hypothetical protein VJU60_07805 [Thermoleophilaceae bacterium]|nr:hypothetical protein [Thermoleophilaceae bacterium]